MSQAWKIRQEIIDFIEKRKISSLGLADIKHKRNGSWNKG